MCIRDSGKFLRSVQGTARGDGEDRHAGAFHGRPEKVRLHHGLRNPLLYYCDSRQFLCEDFSFLRYRMSAISCFPERGSGSTTPFGKAFFFFSPSFPSWQKPTIHDYSCQCAGRACLSWFLPLYSHWHLNELKIWRSEEHTSELQSLSRISYAVFCLKNMLLFIRIINNTHRK